MKKRFGFTLAEVLITLGIIGVVAAMTIPTLIQNTNSIKFVTQFKKSVSTLSQAALMGQAQYDSDYSALDYGVKTAGSCASEHLGSGILSACALFNATLSGQSYQGTLSTLKGADQTAGSYNTALTANKKTTGWYGNDYLVVAMADGAIFGFNPAFKGCSLTAGTVLTKTLMSTPGDSSTAGLQQCLGWIDVNGVQPPNKEVACAGTETTDFATTPCGLSSTGSQIGDIYPIVFHDGTVEPATNAGRAAITRGKSNAGS